MGECGCASGNEIFKLKAPNGWYIVELIEGCDYCSVGPRLQIHHPEAINPMDFGFDSIEDMELMPDLPTIGKDERCVTVIKCGLNLNEAKDAAIECFTGSETEDNQVDETLAEIFGEDFWRYNLSDSPFVI